MGCSAGATDFSCLDSCLACSKGWSSGTDAGGTTDGWSSRSAVGAVCPRWDAQYAALNTAKTNATHATTPAKRHADAHAERAHFLEKLVDYAAQGDVARALDLAKLLKLTR